MRPLGFERCGFQVPQGGGGVHDCDALKLLVVGHKGLFDVAVLCLHLFFQLLHTCTHVYLLATFIVIVDSGYMKLAPFTYTARWEMSFFV